MSDPVGDPWYTNFLNTHLGGPAPAAADATRAVPPFMRPAPATGADYLRFGRQASAGALENLVQFTQSMMPKELMRQHSTISDSPWSVDSLPNKLGGGAPQNVSDVSARQMGSLGVNAYFMAQMAPMLAEGASKLVSQGVPAALKSLGKIAKSTRGTAVLGEAPAAVAAPGGFQEVSPTRFADAVSRFAEARPSERGFLTMRTPDEMRAEGMRTFLSPDGKTGYALHPETGDIRNVFNHGAKGAGSLALQDAVKNGGQVLDAFDTHLTDFYRRHGFKETWRQPWNEQYRPEGWDAAKYGQPDVVGMKYAGEGNGGPSLSPAQLVDQLPAEMQTGRGAYAGPERRGAPPLAGSQLVSNLPPELQTARGTYAGPDRRAAPASNGWLQDMLPKLDEQGAAGATPPRASGASIVAGTALGGAAGAVAGSRMGDTPQERARNSLLLGGLGMAVGGPATSRLLEGMGSGAAGLPALNEIGGAGSRYVAENLAREEAVARMKELSATGANVRMQPQSDGTFSIVQKGPAQALAKPMPKPEIGTLPIGHLGEPLNEAGFQSRLLTTVSQEPDRSLTLQDWFDRLKNNPNVPKAELDATLGKDIREGSGARPSKDRLTTAQLAHRISETTPVANLERTVMSHTGGGEELSRADIEHEAQYLAEQEREMAQDSFSHEIGNRDRALGKIKSLLSDAFGPQNPIMPRIESDYPEAANFNQLNADPGAVRPWPGDLPPAVQDLLTKLKEQNPPQSSLPGMGPPVMSRENRIELENLFIEAQDHHDAAVERFNFEPDMEEMQNRAEESLRENGEYGSGSGDTQYEKHQRVDETAPYREILIHNPDQGLRGGHFDAESRDLQAHARGEIHGKTYLMIEAQSDAAQTARESTMVQPTSDKPNPFMDTEKWVQLSTGASLRQAAEEGLDRFAWVTARDRARRANLNLSAGNITYGSAVPKAVEKIFKWLGEKPEIDSWTGQSGEAFPSVRLTPEMREKILKAGVPALGLAASVVGGVKKLDQSR